MTAAGPSSVASVRPATRPRGPGPRSAPTWRRSPSRTPEDLVLHILDPNREVLPQYLNYTVATVDGRVLTGQIAAESPAAITLKRAEGVTDVVPRDQIEELASTGQSLMPEGLEQEVKPVADGRPDRLPPVAR